MKRTLFERRMGRTHRLRMAIGWQLLMVVVMVLVFIGSPRLISTFYVNVARKHFSGLAINLPLHDELKYRSCSKFHSFGKVSDDLFAENVAKFYSEALDFDPSNGTAWRGLGDLYLAQWRYLNARAMYLRAYELKPVDMMVRLRLGEIAESQGQREQFLEYLKGIPAFDKVLVELGNINHFEGDLDGALNCFFYAVDIAPENGLALMGAGRILELMGRKEEAIVYLDRAVEVDDALYLAYAFRGETLDQLGDWSAAESNLEMAVALAPNNYFVHFIAASVIGQYNRDRAIQLWLEAIRIDPQHVEPYWILGSLYSLDGDFDRALKWCGQALGLFPDDWRSYDCMGGVYYTQHDYSQASVWFQFAVDRNLNHTGIQLLLGQSLLELYQVARAIPVLKHASELAPQNSEIHRALGDAYLLNGQLDLAKREYDLAGGR